MPLLPNGKIDRNNLPRPGGQPDDSSRMFVAPRTAAEESLTMIWSEVLGVGRISVLDNFFDLGGDSILSLRIVARAKNAGLDIEPLQILQYQTIAELATALGRDATYSIQGQLGQLAERPANTLPVRSNNYFKEELRGDDPADFPLARLDRRKLDNLSGIIAQNDEWLKSQE
jgi:hypothetical protein